VGRTSTLPRRALSSESGFTLVETLAVTALLSVVLGAILALGTTMTSVAPRDKERAHAIRDAHTGLATMTRQLRQSYAVLAGTPTSMEVRVRGGGDAARRYVFDCAEPHPTAPGLKRCVRWEVTGAPAVKTPVIDRVADATFTYENGQGVTTSATTAMYVRVVVRVPAAGERDDGYEHLVTLDDAFYMRNRDV
jgi:prepilin-type N-terminal cleavage/methylation domain-containing protein